MFLRRADRSSRTVLTRISTLQPLPLHASQRHQRYRQCQKRSAQWLLQFRFGL